MMAHKRRWSIWGTEYGSDHEVELAQVDGNPQPVLDGFAAKTISLNSSAVSNARKKSKIRKFTWLRIVDNGES